MGGLCGSTFCQRDPVTAGFCADVPLQTLQQPQKKIPLSRSEHSKLKEAGGKANVCRTSASPAEPHLCCAGMTQCSWQGDTVAAGRTTPCRAGAAPQPALGQGKHPAVPQYLPSCRTVVPAASGDSDATARGQPSPRRPQQHLPDTTEVAPTWLAAMRVCLERKTAQKSNHRGKLQNGQFLTQVIHL